VRVGLSKPYVPSSCCVTGENADLKECQTKQDGPPGTELGSQYAGDVNTALFYRVGIYCFLIMYILLFLD